MESRYKVDETKLDRIDRLGLAYCRLNSWEWDEIIGPKPEGFDNLPKVNKYHFPIIMRILSRLFPDKYAKKRSKYDYITPAIKSIELVIGLSNVSRCWWKFELKRTEEEWLKWYFTNRTE